MCNLWGFAWIQFSFSISTGLNAPDRLVQPCTVHHKYIILSYKINHPSGIKLDFKREIYHRVTLSWLKRTWLLEAIWHEPIIPLVVPANWYPLHECIYLITVQSYDFYQKGDNSSSLLHIFQNWHILLNKESLPGKLALRSSNQVTPSMSKSKLPIHSKARGQWLSAKSLTSALDIYLTVLAGTQGPSPFEFLGVGHTSSGG